MTTINRTGRATTALAFGSLLILTMLHAPAAMAATATANLAVSATVTANCSVSTSAVAFGSVNTISGSDTDAAGGIAVNCTSGTAWTATAGVGGGSGATLTTRKMTSGLATLDYSLYTDTGRTTVWGDGTGATATIANTGTGATQNASVYGRVASGQTSVLTGSYTDTVAITLTY